MTECHEVCDNSAFMPTKEFLNGCIAGLRALVGFYCNREATRQMTKEALSALNSLMTDLG